jgi:hypothetical protein
MKKLFLFCNIFCLLSYCVAQETTILVKIKATNEKISFAVIQIPNQNMGFYTNEEGNSKIKLALGDSLIVSCIGYESFKTKINTIPTILEVALQEKIDELAGVEIKSKNLKIIKLSESKQKRDYGFSLGTGLEIASFIENKEKLTYLSDLNFPFEQKKYNIHFRINIYKASDDGFPTNNISNIRKIYQSKDFKTEIQSTDLFVKLPEKGFFVGIELIGYENEKGEIITPGYDGDTLNYQMMKFTLIKGKQHILMRNIKIQKWYKIKSLKNSGIKMNLEGFLE